MSSKQQGFVFIELMYVVAIIGVLAAIAVPSYQDYTERAKIVEPLVSTSEVRAAVNEYFRATGRYPSNNEEAGLAPANAYRGNFFISTTVDKGAIHVELDPLITERTKAKWLSLRPIDNPLALTDLRWSCGYGSANDTENPIGTNKTDIPTQYLPNNCR